MSLAGVQPLARPLTRSATVSTGLTPAMAAGPEANDRASTSAGPGPTVSGDITPTSPLGGVGESVPASLLPSPGDGILSAMTSSPTLVTGHGPDMSTKSSAATLKVASAEKKEAATTRERHVSRAISLPENLDPEKIRAAYENGVLTVTLPKREEVKPRQVAVDVK